MSDKKTFIQCADVETQVFDWGRLNGGRWDRNTLSCGELAPGKGHERTTIRIARRFST